MSLIRNIKSNLYKTFTGYGFYLCIIFTFILCFSSYVYTDYSNGDRYSAFMLIRSYEKDFMLTDIKLSSYEIMKNASGSWVSMFIPIIAAFAFIPLVCDEYEAKSVRFEIFRSSKFKYNLSRFISACVSGGLAVMIGFMLFTLVEWQFFPSISDYQTFVREEYISYMSASDPYIKNMTLAVLCQFGQMFAYGAFYAVPAIALTSVIRNKYLVICIPFFIKYVMNQTSIKCLLQDDWMNYDQKLRRIGVIINPDAISGISREMEFKKEILIYSGILLLIAIVFYFVLQGRRYDSGE